jgi:hypothetical protein
VMRWDPDHVPRQISHMPGGMKSEPINIMKVG